MIDKVAAFVIDRINKMRTIRAPFETDWQDIRYYIRPITQYANYAPQLQFYAVMPETCYDGTAPQALMQLSCALHSYLSNPAERWFEVQLDGYHPFQDDYEVIQWLQTVSDIIYTHYTREGSTLNSALHECYLDIGSFGTCVLEQEWDQDAMSVKFSARPITMCWITEDSKGRVDSLCHQFVWSMRQCMQEFNGELPEGMRKHLKDPDKVFDIIHLVCPRVDRDLKKFNTKNKKWGSYWVCLTTNETILESGYDGFPFHVTRWQKITGEVYGRSPAKICLPDIKMLNQMERTILKAGQKAVDPPIIVDSDAFLLPIKTSPGAMIYREERDAKIEPLVNDPNLPWGEEKSKQKREFIEKCFFADWIRMEKENVEMTAYEVQDRRDEKLRLLSPIFGRLTAEFHGPMIARTYMLLDHHGLIPPAPQSIAKTKLKVGYLSPAAMAQSGTKAVTISRFMQDLAPMAQVNPDVLDAIDLDKAAQLLATVRGIPRTILRTPDELEQVRQQKQQQQAVAQAAQTAEPISKSIANLATASSKSPGGDINNLMPKS